MRPVSREETCSSPTIHKDGDHNNIKEGTVPSNQSTTATGVTVKASKADDTEGDTWQWDVDMLADFPQLEKLSREDMNQVFKALRHGLVQGWKKRIRNETLDYLRERYGKDWYLRRNEDSELKKDAAAIADALSRIYQVECRLHSVLLAMASRI
jgi:hypothetical protein